MIMQTALMETPLALFTTFCSIGAGAFIAMAVAFFTKTFDEERLKRLDKITTIPIAFIIIGFIAAFFHLASPLHAFNVFNNIGASPLSNELMVGCIFAVVAIVYWVIGLAGKLGSMRKAFSTIVAIVGIVFTVFMGLAYGIDTVPTWNNFFVPLSMFGFTLTGGVALGTCIFDLSREEADLKTLNSRESIVAIVGLIIAIISIIGQVVIAQGMSNGLESGSDVVGECVIWVIVSIILLIASVAMIAIPALRAKGITTSVLAVVFAFAGILIARYVFYALYLSSGLSIL